jgi:hypothetical protein
MINNRQKYPHIGKEIERVLLEKGLKKSWLAAHINKCPSFVSKLIKSPSIDMYLLLDISDALNHDFIKFTKNFG